MKWPSLMSVAGAALVIALSACSRTVERVATLDELRNQVWARLEAGVDWQDGSAGAVVRTGGGARTGADSRARLDISDGTIVRLGAATEFLLQDFSAPIQDPVTRLNLTVGKVWVYLTQPLGQGAFEVVTPIGTSSVRGSALSAEYEPLIDTLTATCLDGHCRLTGQSGNFTDLVASEQSEIIGLGADPTPAHPMDAAELQDWTNEFPEVQALVAAIGPALAQATSTPTSPGPPGGGSSTASGTAIIGGDLLFATDCGPGTGGTCCPKGTIYAQNTRTGQIYSQHREIDECSYSLTVSAPGTYLVYGYPDDQEFAVAATWEFLCGRACPETGLRPIDVSAGQAATNTHLSGPYFGSDLPPRPGGAGSIQPTITPTSSGARPLAVCAGAPPTRLAVGMRAYVSTDPPLANRVRDYPSTSGNLVGRMEPGIHMTIVDGPQCSSNWVWWKVQSDSGLLGWTAEGDGASYWLVPAGSSSSVLPTARPTALVSEMRLWIDSINGCTATVNGVLNNVTGPWGWNWGDGATQTGWFPQAHSYAASGTYTVRVWAPGGSPSSSMAVTVSCG